jgi:pimeloyl-ACP methyl ester carboxylesterase
MSGFISPRLVWAISAVLLLAGGPLLARGRSRLPKAPVVLEEEVDHNTNFTPVAKLTKMTVKDTPNAVGWLQKAFEPEKGKKYELLVSLHGHGADPFGFLYYQAAVRRRCFVLIVAGSSRAGSGYAWSDSDKKYVVGLTQHVIAKYPVDPKRVILAGHSAGGRHTFVTHNYAPQIFAGLITTASAGGPGSGQYNVRMVMFFGLKDPNAAMAPSVRSNFGHKKRRAPGSLRMVKELPHAIPDAFYFDQAMEWLLDPNARGGELLLPLTPPVKEWKPFAHVLLRHRDVEGGPRNPTKKQAMAQLKSMKKLLDHKRHYANILMEAALHSNDEKTAASGGLVDFDDLAAFSEAMREAAEKLKPGATSEILESPFGCHLVYRFPEKK